MNEDQNRAVALLLAELWQGIPVIFPPGGV
ncbi:Uncharacterised protein [Escherichia coli]|uniref:Uncharacterized protein n=1 Tax=Escherichia coli TaxID=562 RepID=A0A377A1J1_ECOLX|nr:Uncharacterised protein [Escherichia coli]